MVKATVATGALALALLSYSAPLTPASAAQVPTLDASKAAASSGVILVRRGGGGGGRGFSGGGGGRGFAARSGGGRSFSGRSFSGRSFSGRSFSGRSFSGRSFSGPRVGAGPRRFGSGGRKFARGHGVPRPGVNINPRYDRRHWKKHRRHRYFPGYAIYGAAPYVYDWYAAGDCDLLYERALATDSQYWWARYYECRDGEY